MGRRWGKGVTEEAQGDMEAPPSRAEVRERQACARRQVRGGSQKPKRLVILTPTILLTGGFAIRVYLNDHGPAHVHVWKADAWVVIALPHDDVPVRAVRAGAMKERDIMRALRIVEEHAEALWKAWRRYHGTEAQ